MSFLSYLTHEEVEALHQSSLRILAGTGVVLTHPESLDILTANGASALDWAKRNLALNGLAEPDHGFVQADCLGWLDEQAAAGRSRYGLVFLDPPTTSRSKRMDRSFDVQRDHVELLQKVAQLLEPGGLILFSNNYQRFRLDREALAGFEIEDLSRATIPDDFSRNPRIHVAYLLRRGVAGAR